MFVAVHEEDDKRGGAPLTEIFDDCPEDIKQSDVFSVGLNGSPRLGDAPPIPWLRSKPMQRASLALIAEALMRTLGVWSGRRASRWGSPSNPSTPLSEPTVGGRSRQDYSDAIARERTEVSIVLPGQKFAEDSTVQNAEDSTVGVAGSPRTDFPAMPPTPNAKRPLNDRLTYSGAGNESFFPVFQPHVLQKPYPVLYASPNNPGALKVAEMLSDCAVGLRVESEAPAMATEKKAEEMASPSRHATPGLIRRPMMLASVPMVKRERSKESRFTQSVLTTNPEELGGLRDATHMIVYLNKETFVGPAGERFASELRLVQSDKKLKERVTLLLVHETRMEHGGCDFDRFFHVTPADLVRPPGDLFRTIATPLHAHERHVAVALSQLATTLGAKVKPSSLHHPTPFDVASSGAFESLKESTSSIENATATRVQAAWRGARERSRERSRERRWSFQRRPFSAPGRAGAATWRARVAIEEAERLEGEVARRERASAEMRRAEEEVQAAAQSAPSPFLKAHPKVWAALNKSHARLEIEAAGGGPPAVAVQIDSGLAARERARSVKIDEPESERGLVKQATLGEVDLVVADAPSDADQGMSGVERVC